MAVPDIQAAKRPTRFVAGTIAHHQQPELRLLPDWHVEITQGSDQPVPARLEIGLLRHPSREERAQPLIRSYPVERLPFEGGEESRRDPRHVAHRTHALDVDADLAAAGDSYER